MDSEETYTFVVQKTTIRTRFHVAAHRGLHVHQMEAKTAYLHGDLKETVYMRQPPSFEDPERPNWVCLLERSIYGLK